jgi:outer membrane protein OmpA-like peptidoglycan-associated protein
MRRADLQETKTFEERRDSMRKERSWPAHCGLIATLVLTVAGTSLGQETQKFKGLIVGRDGPTMMVKHENAPITTTVTLDDSTRVQAVKGKLGLGRADMSSAALIPGLPVEVEVLSSNGHSVATTVKFKEAALKTANMIQAGLQPTQQQLADAQEQIEANKKTIAAQQETIQAHEEAIQANKEAIAKAQADQEAMAKRFGQLGDYDVRGTATVLFAVNSSTISAKGKQDLQALAEQAKQINSYMIEVAGYTDSSGNADYNEQLSDRRAAAVTGYLQRTCRIPLFRVLAPDAMGESAPTASNETTQGKAENRRVVAKILVNRGVAGQ